MRTALLLSILALFLPGPARAFCGFYVSGASADLYNNASMVVLAREGTRTVVSMQNNYEGPPQDFALVIPVPEVLREKNVRTVPRALFDKIDTLSAPRLVEYWEQNPCPAGLTKEFLERIPTGRDYQSTVAMAAGISRQKVKVEAEFDVAEYQIVVLSARDSGALEGWLRQHRYNIPSGAAAVLAPYVATGTKFFVARVNLEKVLYQDGQAVLTPLRFYYDSDTFSLPVRLGLLNSGGDQDLIVTVLAEDRYEVANYNNAFIPTNLRVKDSAREQFGALYNGLFRRAAGTDGRTVVTEYAWSSGSCDPCPGPALVSEDVYNLGGDVLSWGPELRPTLTRLHYRYNPSTLGQDLVFRRASPVVGGRGVPDPIGRLLEQVPTANASNQFQGRYVILHSWQGGLTCENPRRGVWGGPQGGSAWAGTAPSPLRGGTTEAATGAALLQVLDEPLPGLEAEAPVGGCSALPGAGFGAAGGAAGGLVLALSLLARRARSSDKKV